jgi:hypothetical protein
MNSSVALDLTLLRTTRLAIDALGTMRRSTIFGAPCSRVRDDID